MGKLKLLIVSFIDLADLSYQGVVNLIFVYLVHNRHLVMCSQNLWWRWRFLCVCKSFYFKGIFVKVNEGQFFKNTFYHTVVTVYCLRVTRYKHKPCKNFCALPGKCHKSTCKNICHFRQSYG